MGKGFPYREHFVNVYFGIAKKLEKEAMMIVRERTEKEEREREREAVESW